VKQGNLGEVGGTLGLGLGTDQFTEKAGGVVDLPLLYLDTFSASSELGLRG